MCRECRKIGLGFTDEKFDEGQHIAYIFNDDNERRRTLSRYLAQGLFEGEKVLYLADEITSEEMRKEFLELGVELTEKESESFNFFGANLYYRPTGFFSCDDMLGVVKKFYNKALEEGYSGARGSGEMTWALKGEVNMLELLEYEAKLTNKLHKYPYTAICQYDARKFSGEMIMDILSIHPMMIVRGQLVKNPSYIGAETFIEEYKRRTA